MYNVHVQIEKTDTALPAGIVFGHTNLTVTDAAGVVQSFALNGGEVTPWMQTVAGLADGESIYSVQDVDIAGATLGAPAVARFTPSPTGKTYPASTAIAITLA